MKIKVTGRHLDLTDQVKERATQEIEKLGKFFGNITSAGLVLSQDNYRVDGELSMNVSRSKLVAKASSENTLTTIEIVTDKMAAQLKKHKEKIKDRKQRGGAVRKSGVALETGVDEVEF